MSHDPEKTPPADEKPAESAPKTPVDGEAQEEAGKVREKSGGYD